MFHQLTFWHSPDDVRQALVDSRLRHPIHLETACQLREFHCFHGFSLNQRAFHCHLVSEHHGSRAVWSGGGDKNLQVDRLFQAIQEIADFDAEARISL